MSYLYCQNSDCGAYLGSLGGDQCGICGWLDNTPPLQCETADETRKDREHAEAYYRQAEALLTSNERALHAEVTVLKAAASEMREALLVARDHIEMDALRVSHCKDAALIDAALAKALPHNV